MPYKRLATIAAAATMMAGAALAQVGGGSIAPSGTVGGGATVGSAAIGGGGGTVAPGNQTPAPGDPVLPNNTRSGLDSGARQAVSVPGNSSQAQAQDGAIGTTQNGDEVPTASTTPPQSIIDQPTPPRIPLPGEAGSNPAEINLEEDALSAQ